MIPILYEKDASPTQNFGIAKLIDSISCDVTTGTDGEYTLTMEYPITGELFRQGEIVVERMIGAIAQDGDRTIQRFRISSIDTSGGVASITAEHVSYQLNWVIFRPASNAGYRYTSTYDLMRLILNRSVGEKPFTVGGGIVLSEARTLEVEEPTPVRGLLIGEEGSIIQQCGGDLKFNNYYIFHSEDFGTDTGVRITYGKNIISADQQVSTDSVYNACLPFWVGKNDKGAAKIIYGDVIALDQYTALERVVPLDVTPYYNGENEYNYDNPPTEFGVTNKGWSILRQQKVNRITPAINVDFVPLWQTLEYKEIADFERVQLFDTVTVSYAAIGIESKAKIVRTVFDALNERYKEITIGRARSTLADKIAKAYKNGRKKI